MNKISYISAALLVGLTLTGCREENTLLQGDGRMTLSTSVMSDIKVVSRALSDEEHNALASSALIWVSKAGDNKPLYKFHGLTEFPKEGLPLSTGTYIAQAWIGDSIPASWSGKRYHGYEQFDIASGEVTPVNIKCPVRNTLVTVNLGEKIAEVLKDVSLTVALNDGLTDGSHSLEFVGEKLAETGYFMINQRTKGFLWTIYGTDNQGKAFTRSGEYKDPAIEDEPYLARATQYIFNINYDYQQGDVEIGGAFLDIDVEAEPVVGTEEKVVITLAPEIVGLDGFDIAKGIMAEPGMVGRVSTHVIGAAPLKEVHLESPLLSKIFGDEETAIELLGSQKSYIEKLSAAGIKFQTFDNRSEDAKADGSSVVTNLRLNLEEQFTQTLTEGEHKFTITASDTDPSHTPTIKSFIINVTKAPGQLVDIDENKVSYTSATLSAEIKTPGTRMGFEIIETAYARAFTDWTFVKGEPDGTTLTAEVSGLKDGTEYSYRLVVDDYTSTQVLTFITPAYPQLPNSSFESWIKYGKDDKILVPGTEYPSFWDTGNHGSATMSVNVTQSDPSIKHSGSYSAKLQSQFVGLGALGKFAAGNIFTGKYLDTEGTDGVLGWGQPFTERPKALKGYIKYTPGAVQSSVVNKAYSNPEGWVAGTMDQGIIYIALLTADKTEYTSKEKWPVVIRTKKGSQKLFDPNADNVVAYGVKVFESATEGDGMVPFEIELSDVHGDKAIGNILIVASASRYGDYFLGGEGSTMWLDDLELVY